MEGPLVTGPSHTTLVDATAAQSDDTLRLLGAVPRGDFRQLLPLLKVAVKLDPALLRSFPGAMEAAATLEKAQQDLQTVMGDFQATSDRMVTDAGGAELSVAIEAGLLTLSPSGLAEDAKTMDAILANYVGILTRHLQDPQARMLFDGQAAALVRSMVAAGAVTPHPLALTGAGQAALASGFVARLPVFAPAPMDEVLDLRRDLSEPLIRYRRAISQMSTRLTYQAYESETAVEIDNLWREEVEPALLEIREQMADHGLTREVVRVLRTDLRSFIAGLTSGGSMWVGVETLTSLTGAAAALSGLATGVGVTGSHTVLKGAQQRRDARVAAERHELFYLYELDRRLQ